MLLKQEYTNHYQKIGFFPVSGLALEEINDTRYTSYIKILYLPENYELTVDFTTYKTRGASLFFIGSDQFLRMDKGGESHGYFLYYNRDFYCIQIHDAEVACDGLLFNNIYQLPVTEIPEEEDLIVSRIYEQIREEFSSEASGQEEMLRTYLKQLIIRATRLWKRQNLGKLLEEPPGEIEFYRDFSRLVEIHFRQKHKVSDYAAMLGVAAKTLSNKFKRHGLISPNEVIKERIVLEAKRLLHHTGWSVKQIAYDLGYDDPAYFNRLFTNKAGYSPAVFRQKYLSGKKVQ
ncbi:AraC-type DNA-binding protein [Sinomicrobium oceani]|uniref:AraC-type DNA-binding protein n=1 Tax=Sinomicrobium oceani TaxID=1150368 RepID=A0A1K1PWY6_9FLAO|nr:helix-turn-helix domain-containing protein [Sinomicrobium oceani]SFW51963.1 AraC-type DNA-binding protein [Sinomicrobium oceani]